MKTWFITGASRGFGRIWAEAARSRGTKLRRRPARWRTVAISSSALARAVLALPLDVNDKEQVKQAVAQAHAHFGRLDIV
jgi:NAD(P)-dependent dehydrogenase (short-subunit alcohol dehydrogenase family)